MKFSRNRAFASIVVLLMQPAFAGLAATEAEPASMQPRQALDGPHLEEHAVVLPKGGIYDTPARSFVLPALSAAEKSSFIRSRSMEKADQVGLGRALPDAARSTKLDELAWTAAIDGTRFTTVELRSTDAAAVRVSIDRQGLGKGLQILAYGTTLPDLVYGPYDSYGLDPDAGGALWLPAIEGDVVRLEIRAGQDIDLSGRRLSLTTVSHIVQSIRLPDLKRLADIGSSGSCNIDIACRAEPYSRSGGVAKYFVTDPSGKTGSCTGTLLNSESSSSPPPAYFITANHCVPSQAEASTLQLYWFFERSSCSGPNPSRVSETTGGGTLRFSGSTNDVAFLRLNQAPPAGVYYAGWTTTALVAGADVNGIHHPAADLKKYSRGTFLNFAEFGQDTGSTVSSHIRVRWSEGTTEGGSSGSGLFNASGQLIGTLHGGGASCAARTNPDWYGRFDQQYPSIAQFLRPGTPAPPPAPAPTPAPTAPAPIALSSGLPVTGSVVIDTSVWYRLQASTSQTGATVLLSNLTDDADLAVYLNSQTATPACTSIQASTTSDSCTVTFTGAPTVYIKIVGYRSASYTLTATLTTPAPTPTPVPTPTTTAPASDGGGGGMVSPALLAALSMLRAMRAKRRRPGVTAHV